MEDLKKETFENDYGKENVIKVFNSSHFRAYLIFYNDKYILRTVDRSEGRKNFQQIALCKRDFFNLLKGISKTLIQSTISICSNRIRKITS